MHRIAQYITLHACHIICMNIYVFRIGGTFAWIYTEKFLKHKAWFRIRHTHKHGLKLTTMRSLETIMKNT